MSNHDWDVFGFASQRRCRKCGLVIKIGGLSAYPKMCTPRFVTQIQRAIDREAMENTALRPPAGEIPPIPRPDLGKAMKEAEKTALGYQAATVEDLQKALRWQADRTTQWHQIAESRQAALDCAAKTIANLEAEVESLSRQLRSREINAETVSTGKRWRWSPLL